ncbi:Diphthamide biosynthesis protein 4 [Escovopsis weberi]|uniref:Diphthamide biosynthesis protein 4 n=1 Tax=Escovopsis weberi TaxID=150374 RepID=A0A0M8N475_ESCWE|nr:Diphthamide biosynthesis protein 4 [Escovopsis weberi]
MEKPTHYHVLGISPSLLESQTDPSALLKQAYRRALLRHHPDKSRSQAPTPTPPHTCTCTCTSTSACTSKSAPTSADADAHPHGPACSSSCSTSCTTARKASRSGSASASSFSIDQISSALAVLSSPRRRAEYDASLRVSRAAAGRGEKDAAFQTGIESVDLDDLELDERGPRWHRSCRCGNERGYAFGEDDLLEVEHEGVLMVGCQDCSLWLQVHFAVLEEEGEDHQDDGRHRDRTQAMSNGKNASH